MARIRTIKPQLPQDARLASLPRATRYHFVLLITISDDAGYFRAASRQLLALYPHDPDVSEREVSEMTADLAKAGFLALQETNDGPIGHIIKWRSHQKIDKPSRSFLEPLFMAARGQGELFAEGSRDPREDVPDRSQGVKESNSQESSSEDKAVTPEFLTAWALYPRRYGSNPRHEAYKRWHARIKAGVTPELMTDGVKRYKRYCDVTGKTGTEFVMQATRFFGPSKEYENTWEVPGSKNQQLAASDEPYEAERF